MNAISNIADAAKETVFKACMLGAHEAEIVKELKYSVCSALNRRPDQVFLSKDWAVEITKKHLGKLQNWVSSTGSKLFLFDEDECFYLSLGVDGLPWIDMVVQAHQTEIPTDIFVNIVS